MGYLKAKEEDMDAFLKEIKPVFDRYKPLGIRIEDDILITEDGNENLSAKAPRTVKEIERLMRKRSYLNQ